jgi:hypothetical protein
MTTISDFGKLITEGIIIVASILLAFAIDALWEQRQNRKEELELLNVIYEDVESNILSQSGVLERIERDNALFTGFVQSTPLELSSVDAELARNSTNSIMRPNSRALSQSLISRLANSERIETISNGKIRSSLYDWNVIVGEIDERVSNLAALEIEGALLLSKHEQFQRSLLSELSEKVDLRPIRSDESSVALGFAMLLERRIYSGWVEDSIASLENLRLLISDELGI